ncbi:concanavalin A-like lectin/glucanase domain-containing protein [Nemania serpens]|nr:concanavalin A-like lectin/glucanase domain-containing protein [Nemania serpens]
MRWEDPPPYQERARPAAFQIRDSGSVESLPASPPRFRTGRRAGPTMAYIKDQPWWKPQHWRVRTWVIAGVVLVVIIIAIVVPVKVTEANRYPNYSTLDYSLIDEYSGSTFFDNFDYFEGYDPAQGFVHYVPKERATQLNLTYASESTAVLKVDTSVGPGSLPADASTGRFSVRVESKRQYNKGLFIFDVRHTPYGCGTWPALWLTDQSNWPDHGEIDIMEAVNQATDGNQMTLHTTKGCSVDGVKRKMTGSSLNTNCYNNTNNNAGCGVSGPPESFGIGYNSAQGGIVAMEWRNQGIRMWQFGRDSIPADITAKSPNPSSWGEAAADFPDTDCKVQSHFRNQSIIANIDLCGQYANGVYPQSGCPGTCSDFVANNPNSFTDAFWEFGAFQVYQAI